MAGPRGPGPVHTLGDGCLDIAARLRRQLAWCRWPARSGACAPARACMRVRVRARLRVKIIPFVRACVRAADHIGWPPRECLSPRIGLPYEHP